LHKQNDDVLHRPMMIMTPGYKLTADGLIWWSRQLRQSTIVSGELEVGDCSLRNSLRAPQGTVIKPNYIAAAKFCLWLSSRTFAVLESLAAGHCYDCLSNLCDDDSEERVAVITKTACVCLSVHKALMLCLIIVQSLPTLKLWLYDGLFVHSLWAGVQPTLDPSAEIF